MFIPVLDALFALSIIFLKLDKVGIELAMGVQGRSAYGWIVSGDFHILKGVGLEQGLKDGRGLGEG